MRIHYTWEGLTRIRYVQSIGLLKTTENLPLSALLGTEGSNGCLLATSQDIKG